MSFAGEDFQPCPPQVEYWPHPEGVLYLCAAGAVRHKDPTDQKQACPSVGASGAVPVHWTGPVGTRICKDCHDTFEKFMRKAHDAQARREEHAA